MTKEWIAYDVKARKKVKLVNPELVTLKNGRKALKAQVQKLEFLFSG